MFSLNKLTKLASRKNLSKLILKEINNVKKRRDKIKILNIGSGGEIANLIKNINGVDLFNVDIDPERKPDLVFDICNFELKKHLPFKPDIITIFEVLEHVENPFKAIENINQILDNDKICLGSVPFNFHIHDEPNDYFRFTSFGLKKLFSGFKIVQIINRNGWLESIFVNFIRLYKEKNIFSKLIGVFLQSFILYFIRSI